MEINLSLIIWRIKIILKWHPNIYQLNCQCIKERIKETKQVRKNVYNYMFADLCIYIDIFNDFKLRLLGGFFNPRTTDVALLWCFDIPSWIYGKTYCHIRLIKIQSMNKQKSSKASSLSIEYCVSSFHA